MPKKSKQTLEVERWLLANPEATNSQLYAQFPKVPKPSLRRIASSIRETRKARKLAALLDAAPLAYKRKVERTERHNRQQIALSRSLKVAKIQIPLSEDVIHLLQSIFVEADDLATSENFDIKLSAYSLVVEVAREGRMVRGKVKPMWSGEYITIPGRLKPVRPRELWTDFEDYAIERVNNITRGEALVKASIVAHSKSDPLFVRPAKLTIYMHAEK